MGNFQKDTSLLSGKGEWDEEEHPRDSDGKFTSKGGEQSTTSQVKSEKTAIKKEPKSLNSQIDAVLNGTYKDSHITMLNETPKIMQEIGIPNKPFLMTAKHVYLAINNEGKYTNKKDHYHGLGKETFELIPKLLQSPTMVLKNNRAKNELIAVLSWYDKNKNILIAPIKINGRGNENFIEIESNIIKSTYGRENFKNYINDNFSQDDILIIENKKIRDFNLED